MSFHDDAPSTKPLLMRSVMYTPGNNPKLIASACTLTADVIVLDMEDSVPAAEKENARALVRQSIGKVAGSGAHVYVRVNAWDTGLTDADLVAVAQPVLRGIVLPKAESGEDILKAGRKLSELEKAAGMEPGAIAVQPLIETARSVLNAYQIASASPRVNSLAFGAVDYTRDMRVKLTPGGQETFVARALVAMAARAAGLVAVDSAWPAFTDTEGFVRDSQLGRQLGYEGRILVHPSQIGPAHQVYSPAPEEVEGAREVATAFEEGLKKGLASVSLKGQMVDRATYRAARDILTKADTIAQAEARWTEGRNP